MAARDVTTKALAAVGRGQDSGMCEKFTRSCFGFPAKYSSAKLAYEASKRDGAIHKSFDAPAGVPVFWDITYGVNAPYDHVAVSVGSGYCVSTSAGPNKTVAKVRIEDLTRRWGMIYRGWAEVYHGQRVYELPKKEVKRMTNDIGYEVWSYRNDDVELGDRDTYSLLRGMYKMLVDMQRDIDELKRAVK